MLRRLSTIAFSLLAACSAFAGEIIFDQTGQAAPLFGPINHSSTVSSEAADDFEVVAKIDKVVFNPARSYPWSAPPPVSGVTLRFYSWNNGVPGALQYERLFTGDDLFIMDGWQMERVELTLREPFNANGKHFISVQMHCQDEEINWWGANAGAPKGAAAVVRNRKVNGAWTIAQTDKGRTDAAFRLEGVLVGTPVINSLNKTTVPRSGRVLVEGKYFGGTMPQVLVNNIPAILAGWNQSQVKFWVPESAPIGTNTVKIITDNGVTNQVPLNVTTRQPDGRIKWKFETINAYTVDVPVVSPTDGTICVHDSLAIYALSPDGGLKWLFGELPYIDRIDVGHDGTLYTACNDEVYAINPADGSVKWKFDPPFAGNWPNNMGGPNVGPDGNIYHVHNSIAGGLGVYSLTPQGTLRWKYAPLVGEYKPTPKKIAFTPGKVHVTIAHEDNGTTSPYMDELLTLDLNGKFLWRVQYVATSSPIPNPANGDIYVNKLAQVSAITNDGKIRWQQGIGLPTVGPDGTLYSILNYGLRHVAIEPISGSTKWTAQQADHNFELHNISPNNQVLMGAVVHQPTSTPDSFKPYLQALNPANGAVLWRQYVPNHNTHPEFPGYGYFLPKTPAFSKDSTTAYYGSLHNADYSFNMYTYVFAVDTGTGTPTQTEVDLAALKVATSKVVGGESTTAQVVLTGATATTAAVSVTDNSSALVTPASTQVAPGTTTGTFTISTTPVTATYVRTVSATFDGVTKTAYITITPGLKSLALASTSVVGGTSTTATVTLLGPAPTGGQVVQLSDNSSAVTTPVAVTILAGATSATFTVGTSKVTTSAQRMVYAKVGSVTKTVVLTITAS